jgi:hypothetical protein
MLPTVSRFSVLFVMLVAFPAFQFNRSGSSITTPHFFKHIILGILALRDDFDCGAILNVLQIGPFVDCDCTTRLDLAQRDLVTTSECKPLFDRLLCTPVFCFSLGFDYERGVRQGLIVANFYFVFSALNGGVVLLPDLTVTAYGSEQGYFQFDVCEVEIEGKECTCTVCPSGRSFSFTCTDGTGYDFCVGIDTYQQVELP